MWAGPPGRGSARLVAAPHGRELNRQGRHRTEYDRAVGIGAPCAPPVDLVEHDDHDVAVARQRPQVAAVVDRRVGVLLRVEYPNPHEHVDQRDEPVGLQPVRHLRRVVVGQVEQHQPEVRVTVPDTWDHVGVLGVKASSRVEDGWEYPSTPGQLSAAIADSVGEVVPSVPARSTPPRASAGASSTSAACTCPATAAGLMPGAAG